MSFLLLDAFANLIRFGHTLAQGNFAMLYEKVRRYPLGGCVAVPDIVARICYAVDVACVWYPKQVLCLQRSAATACLLRKHNVPALLVIGAQRMPFRAHAWVEVDGQVVNDKPYMKDIYAILDRC